MSRVRRVAVLTSGRQDWGIVRSTCAALRAAQEFELFLLTGGMHLDPRYGLTKREIQEDGFAVAAEIAWLSRNAAELGYRDLARAVAESGPILDQLRLDCLLLVGDRIDTLAVALAATLGRIPIVHLHGGEETEGSFDNACRHAITKLSHLHLVSHELHARRVRQMGEDPEKVHVVGAPGLDNFFRDDLPSRAELERDLASALRSPLVIVTYHPSTLGDARAEVEALAAAIRSVPEATYVITLPNADPGSAYARQVLGKLGRGIPNAAVMEALGTRRHFGLLRRADVVLGNSSSGILESELCGVVAVNVGDRQKGRLRSGNVIDVVADVSAISEALRRAFSMPRGPRGAGSIYGDGHSGERIVRILEQWEPKLRKPFRDLLGVDAVAGSVR